MAADDPFVLRENLIEDTFTEGWVQGYNDCLHLTTPPDTPAEWATVDRCLTWLRERGYESGAPFWNGDGYDLAVITDGPSRYSIGFTYHAALIAACQAVAESEA